LTPVSVPTNGLIRVSGLLRKTSSAASAKRPSREISDKPPALGSRSVGSLPDDGGGGARQPQRLSQSVAKARSIFDQGQKCSKPMTALLRSFARALSGDVSGRNSVSTPAPGHSAKDRALSIVFDPKAPGGFIVSDGHRLSFSARRWNRRMCCTHHDRSLRLSCFGIVLPCSKSGPASPEVLKCGRGGGNVPIVSTRAIQRSSQPIDGDGQGGPVRYEVKWLTDLQDFMSPFAKHDTLRF
jgi:hypothetical protein